MVLLSDIQAKVEVRFQWTEHCKKAYNKSAKGQGEIVGISRRKQAVCKWNIIKHEKCMNGPA